MTSPARVLLIDATEGAVALQGVVAAAGVACDVVADGDDAWRLLARVRPTAVLIDADAPNGHAFLRRIRDEYMGQRPVVVALSEGRAPDLALPEAEFDAVLLRPLAADTVRHLFGTDAASHRPVDLDPARIVELIRLSALSGDLQQALDRISHRLRLLYGAADAVVLAIVGDRQWVGSVGQVPKEQWKKLWIASAQAANTGAPLIASTGPDGAVETRFGLPIVGATGAVIGAVCLRLPGPHRFGPIARDALGDLAARLGHELSWRSVHAHLIAERDRLRESAMIDPLLGVFTAAALEQALATEVHRLQRSGEPMTVSVIDISGLRLINDRHGHVAGDAALRHVAEVARRIARGQDVVARYGGDEIALLLGGTPVEGASVLLERICKAVEAEPLELGEGEQLTVRVTAGVAQFLPSDGSGGATLVRAARAAKLATRAEGSSIVIADATIGSADTHPEAMLGPADRYEAGVTLGGMYEIVHEISRGSMGVVYRAEDLGLGRPVAIKMLRPDLVTDHDLVTRFREEAAVLAALHHPNLVQVYAFGEDKSDVYFVMELVEGVSLDDVIAEGSESGQWPATDRVATIIEQVGSALDAMHDAGVLHRDVKPGNIVLDRAHDRVVLVDVGLAKPFGAANDLSGTPGYIAPETFRGEDVKMSVDVYGLAATAYAALLQRAPFGEAEDYHEILHRQAAGPPKPPSRIRRDLPAALDAVFASGLAVEPSRRQHTAGQFARELKAALLPGSRRAKTAAWPAFDDDAAGTLRRATTQRPAGTPTLEIPAVVVPDDDGADRMSRGVVFRSAPRVLGLSNAVAWMSGIARKNRPLADAMSPRTSPLSWQPTRLFLDLLREVLSSGRNPDAFAREVARRAVADTFRRFYPTKAESLDPVNTLSAIHVLWRRYHSWGQLLFEAVGPGEARAQLCDAPLDAGLCAFTAGLLEQAVVLSGGASVDVQHPECRVVGDSACWFSIRWAGG
jgi:diguanylate cyclase (GGDEF)-like protein